ncbi:MAG: NAD(P)-dependent oxidoreductase [Gammaproteobacteria bacterium]|nr:NAD(P)-dependent oxidoreductase [Gammaproteobacteria bacterium]
MMGNTSITGSNLPVLNAVCNAVKRAGAPSLGKVLFVCVQHLLYTSTTLFEKLIQLGTNPDNIFLMGKHYSLCEDVAFKLKSMGIQLQPLTPLADFGEYTSVFKQDVSNMWHRVQGHIQTHQNNIDCIVVLDDGGRCLERLAEDSISKIPIIGIEQTTAGLFNHENFNSLIPFIDIATCAAKIHLEPDSIADALLSKIKNKLAAKKGTIRCGVVGLGTIGKAVAKKLLSLGYKVYGYDNNNMSKINFSEPPFILCNNLQDIFQRSNFIFGCTGRDLTSDLKILELIDEDKTFLSCTSEDKEFLNLLKNISKFPSNKKNQNPLNDVNLKLPNGKNITILKGGFPINFDDTGESASPEKIQLTRGLLLAGVIQAVATLPQLINDKITGRIMLHPECQKFVASEWLKLTPNNHSNFSDLSWVIENSNGAHYHSQYLSKCFGSTQSEPEKAAA